MARGRAATPQGRPAGDTDPDEPAVLCRDLVRVYAVEDVEVQALQGLSLRIDHGELVSVVGASGSGKSTLLSILSGIDRPTAGTARVAGYELTRLDRRQRVAYQRSAVGFVWQQTARNLVPYLTGAQNVALVLAVAGARDRRRRVEELLELTGAQDQADRVPAEMSGGQQQQLAIAVALANAPAVLLADEPTGELDDESTARVLDTLRTVNTELGTTTVIVTHDAAVAEHVRRTIRIRDGRIAAETVRTTDDLGRETATEYAVLDRVGRLQLPPEVVRSLGLRDRVLLGRSGDGVLVRPGLAGPVPPDEVATAAMTGPTAPPPADPPAPGAPGWSAPPVRGPAAPGQRPGPRPADGGSPGGVFPGSVSPDDVFPDDVFPEERSW